MLRNFVFLVLSIFTPLAQAESVLDWDVEDGAITILGDDQWLGVRTLINAMNNTLWVSWNLYPQNDLESCKFGLSESPKDLALVMNGEVIGIQASCVRIFGETIYEFMPKNRLYESRIVDMFKRSASVKIDSDIASFTVSAKGFTRIWDAKANEHNFKMPFFIDQLDGIRTEASRGSVIYKTFLAMCYHKGDDYCELDHAVGFKWGELAAVQGDASGQMQTGIAYLRGHGVEKDVYKAAEMFSKSARQGLHSSQYYLSLMYWEGKGVLKDPISAYMWINISAANGYEKAKEIRDGIEDFLSPSQLEKANSKARKCMASNYKDC